MKNRNNIVITILIVTMVVVQPELASGVDTNPCGKTNPISSERFKQFIDDYLWGPKEPATAPSAMEVGFATSMGSLAQLSWSIYGICKAPENLISLLESADSFVVLERYDRNNEKHHAQKRAGGTRREYVYGRGGEQYYHRYLVPVHPLSEHDKESLISQIRDRSPFYHVRSHIPKSGVFITSDWQRIIRVSGPDGSLDINLDPQFRRINFRQGPVHLAGGNLYPDASEFWKDLVEKELTKD